MKLGTNTRVFKRTFQNTSEHPILLRLEPWGDEGWVQPGSRVEVRATGPEANSVMEVEEDGSVITVYGWPGSTIVATCNAVIVASGEVPAPRTPMVRRS